MYGTCSRMQYTHLCSSSHSFLCSQGAASEEALPGFHPIEPVKGMRHMLNGYPGKFCLAIRQAQSKLIQGDPSISA